MSEPSFSGWAESQTGNPKDQVCHVMTYELTKIRKEIHILYSLVVSIQKLLFLAFQDFSLFCLALILL